MREPEPFRLLMKIEQERVTAALAEVPKMSGWGTNRSKSLGDPRRRSAMFRNNNLYPATGICGPELINTCYNTDNIERAPTIWSLVQHIAQATGWTELGLVTVSITGPGGVITPHVDGGAYFSSFHRVQVPLATGPGITFTCEDVTIQMMPGEVWCLDNKRVHWVNNNSSNNDRINLLFDARTPT